MSETVNQIKERLQRYSAMQRDIDNQIERLERLQAALGDPASPSLSGMPRGSAGGTDKIGRRIERVDQLEGEIRLAIEQEAAEKAELEALICQLRDPDERAVIRMRYFDKEGWGDIADVLFGDYQYSYKTALNRTYTLHGDALSHLAAMEDRAKSGNSGKSGQNRARQG